MERGGQMPIPGCLIAGTELLDFGQSLEAALVPCPEYDVSKWLYVPNTYQECR